MTEGAGDVCFLHVSYNLILFPFANFARFIIHEGCSKFVSASFAYLCAEGNLVCFFVIVEAFDDDVLKLRVVVLTQLAIFDVLFELLGADEAV